MRMILFAALLAASSAVLADESEPLFDGVSYRQQVRSGDNPMVAHIITLDLTRPGIKLALTPPNRSKGMEHVAYTTSSYLTKSGAQVAVNASYFLPFNGGSPKGEDYYPKQGQPVQVSGMARGGGQPVSPIEIDQDNRVTAIICMNGADVRIADGQRCKGLSATPCQRVHACYRAVRTRHCRLTNSPAMMPKVRGLHLDYQPTERPLGWWSSMADRLAIAWAQACPNWPLYFANWGRPMRSTSTVADRPPWQWQVRKADPKYSTAQSIQAYRGESGRLPTT